MASTFAEKVAALGPAGTDQLERYVVFDASHLAVPWGGDIGYFINAGSVNPTPAVMDATTRCSGQDSVKFTVGSLSDGGSPGQLYVNFSAARDLFFGQGETFTCQWMQKWERYMIEHTFSGDGFKQMILSRGDPPTTCTTSSTGTCQTSNTGMSVVMQNAENHDLPRMYGYRTSIWAFEDATTHPPDILYQNAMPSPYCRYGTGPNYDGCLHYRDGLIGVEPTTRWATITMEITPGTYNAGTQRFDGTNIKVWWSWEGNSTVYQLFDYTDDFGAEDSNGWGKIWLTPYITGKSTAEVHTTTHCWYQNFLLISGSLPSALRTTQEVDQARVSSVAAGMLPGQWAEVTVDASKSILLEGSSTGNIFAFSFNLEWYNGFAIFVGEDHRPGTPANATPKVVKFTETTNVWTELIPYGDDDHPTSIQGHSVTHGYAQQAYDGVNNKFYYSEYLYNQDPKLSGCVPGSAWAQIAVSSLGASQIATGLCWWSGTLTGGGSNGTIVNYQSAFDGYILRYRPLTANYAADIHVAIGADTYHSFMRYNPTSNLAIFGGGNANPTLLMRLNANATVTQLNDAPFALGVQRGNVVAETATGGFLVLKYITSPPTGSARHQLWYLDPTGTGTWTLESDAVPSGVVFQDFPEGGEKGLVSASMAEYDVVGYVSAIPGPDITMWLYRKAGSSSAPEPPPPSTEGKTMLLL